MPANKCKLPTYITHNPLVWFKAVEANLNMHKVVDPGIQAALVVAALLEKQLESIAPLRENKAYDYMLAKDKQPVPPSRPQKSSVMACPYCWYHASFGESACACKPGCSWLGNELRLGQ